ncbi:small acid-soluble spore protein Tlp [Cytobacillus sp. NJ13]|nr:small acid-soluble spore protein Tlp [Cytobacillus sp. NJ13]
MSHNRPNPDDRSDNVEKLQSMIVHTIENMDEAEESMKYANAEDLARIEAKNERRRESLASFRSEIKDEYQAQQNDNANENNENHNF